jgi:hypothetical protein
MLRARLGKPLCVLKTYRKIVLKNSEKILSWDENGA